MRSATTEQISPFFAADSRRQIYQSDPTWRRIHENICTISHYTCTSVRFRKLFKRIRKILLHQTSREDAAEEERRGETDSTDGENWNFVEMWYSGPA